MIRFIPRKHPAAARTLSADSCGCAMGARFLGVTLVASIGYFACHWREYSFARAGVLDAPPGPAGSPPPPANSK